MERHLAYGHIPAFLTIFIYDRAFALLTKTYAHLQIVRRCIYYCEIILLVSYIFLSIISTCLKSQSTDPQSN